MGNKIRGCEPGKAIIVDETRSGRPITATDENHRKLVDDVVLALMGGWCVEEFRMI
jgi:hypothetical protein